MREGPTTFGDEQRGLSAIWTFVGVTSQLTNDNSWLRCNLWDRSIFIQRFGERLTGFLNVCAHRFYPLRTADSGVGEIRCGLHGWRFDDVGAAAEIPACEDVFGQPAEKIRRRLRRIDVEVCGEMIFARIPTPERQESLVDFLGDFEPIVGTLTRGIGGAVRDELRVESHWTRSFDMTMDDYHMTAVHPETLGKNGHLLSQNFRYFREKCHSAFFVGESSDKRSFGDEALENLVATCRRTGFAPHGYRTFNIFPNLLLCQSHKVAGRRFVVVSKYDAVSQTKCLVHTWCFTLQPVEGKRLSLWQRLTDPVVLPFARSYTRKIYEEDKAAAEQLEIGVSQAFGRPLLGRHEKRIGWHAVELRNALSPSLVEPTAERDRLDPAAFPSGNDEVSRVFNPL